jgi:hypothetical protein
MLFVICNISRRFIESHFFNIQKSGKEEVALDTGVEGPGECFNR